MVYTIVFMRHGESEWNLSNRFTGWVDCKLSEKGVQEAIEGGKLIKEHGYEFDLCYTSLLKRAITTANYVLEVCDQLWIPQFRSWKLNERMYGALEGLNKRECVEKHGEKQVMEWRRSYGTPPPAMAEDSELNHAFERKYANIDGIVPMTECLKDCVERVVPFWNTEIVPALKANKRIFIAAHGNSLRALVKHLDNISEKDIVNLNIPTGIPLVYNLGEDLLPIPVEDKKYSPLTGTYLGNENEIKAKIEGVANQASKK
ncbi:hypothetical protein Zmor_004239 [Zophobas morio]|jgi:2,3-bisphosphoglycerate-dependent phosphoglycerate mutase|uniref:phosphoglycerate mutase (2,3-diphosphoglycerate-dependent) n=1 Tax=Zophobas morio TaxID=2755281 RepID=A0AA38M149_9CUCU|nr:hypothetical protein Zmor_004239 [Zophobas morio]